MPQILDFTRLLPGPLATKILAEQGCRVIKLEIPHKPDPLTEQPPFDEKGNSVLYQSLNGNKTIEKIDYTMYSKDLQIQGALDKLLSASDVLVEQYRPGVMQLWGLGYEQLRLKYPKLVYISITGYGQNSPLSAEAGHDITYLAYGGILSQNLDKDGNPVIPNIQIADIAAGSYPAVTACYKALYERSQTGQGQYIDISMLDNLRPLLTIPNAQRAGGWNPREANFLSGLLVNYNLYRCSDGKWLALGALETKFWNNFCLWAGRPDWQRHSQLELSIHIFPKHEVEAFFLSNTRDHWVSLAFGKDICLAPVMD